jgi:hypothetical protein
MSFLRNHLRHFVLPGIYTLAHSRGKTITALDIKPRDKEVRPSTDCKFVEAGMLYAVVSSVLKKGDPVREIALGLCRQIGQAKDAEFVYEIDKRGGIKGLGEGYNGVEGSDVLHSMLCNSMRRLKRKMRRSGQLLLPGRDVWSWEVLARKLAVDSTYDPRVSRAVASSPTAIESCINDWKIQNWSDVLFFDTGFSGSIPRAIAGSLGLTSINMLLLSSYDEKAQIFRTHTGSRKKALAFEYLAKYFQSGTTRDGKPYQALADLDEFIKAALLTIWLWHHVSPTKLPSYREKKLPGSKLKLTPIPSVPIGMNPAYFGKLTIDGMSGSTGAAGTAIYDTFTTANSSITNTPQFVINSSWTTAATTGFAYQPVIAAQTLDHLWGAGASGQLMLDAGVESLPKQPPKEVFHSQKLKQVMLDPATFELKDAQTGKSIEKEMDAKVIAMSKGIQEPTEEGFALGQYPGPPVVSSKAIKQLANLPVDGPIPDINLSLESGPAPNGIGLVNKVITVVSKDGTKKIFKAPLTG